MNNEDEPDVYIVCIKCGFKEPIENVKDEHYFLCNECYLSDRVDLSMISDVPILNPGVIRQYPLNLTNI